MKLSIFVFLALTLSGKAMAWDCTYWSQTTNPTAECYKAPTTGGGSNTNTNSSNQTQGQGQTQGQTQGQGQSSVNNNANSNKNTNTATSASTSASSSSTASAANNAGNSQNIIFGDQRVAAASAIAGVGDTTAKCRYHDGAGVQLIGFGVSFGKSRADSDCRKVAYADLFYARGDDSAGNRMLCSIKDIRNAMGDSLDDCLALVNELHAVKQGSGTAYVTQQELQAVIKRGLVK